MPFCFNLTGKSVKTGGKSAKNLRQKIIGDDPQSMIRRD
jgi:hypothetical protein